MFEYDICLGARCKYKYLRTIHTLIDFNTNWVQLNNDVNWPEILPTANCQLVKGSCLIKYPDKPILYL